MNEYIDVITDTSEDSMCGADGWGDVDASASVDKFLEMLSDELARQFPGVAVTVTGEDGQNNIATNVNPHHETIEVVRGIITDVWSNQEWCISA